MKRRGVVLVIVMMLFLLQTIPGACSGAFMIHIDVEAKRLTLFQGDEIIMRCAVATGAWDTPTPLGIFRINSRFSGQLGGFGTCFLGLNVPWGQYGIHGTNKPESIGGNASHGCIRLNNADAEKLYDRVPDGTVVVIQSGAYGELGDTLRTLHSGDRSSMVRAVQRKLRALGYYHGWPDGIYGAGTDQAVQAARKSLGLPPGDVDWRFYHAIGLTLFE